MPPVYSTVVADDVDDLRFLVRMALERSGRFKVVGEADNGVDAVNVVEQLQPDLLLLDISMPAQDGLESLPHVLKKSPGTKVVMLSGFEASRLADQAMERGASGYLEKGVHPGKMVESVLKVMEDGADGGGVAPEAADPPPPSLTSDELLSFVGHELRSPLAVIQGFGAALQEQWADMRDEQRIDLVGRMTANAAYLDAVLTNIIQMRATTDEDFHVHLAQEDVDSVVAMLVNDFKPLAKGRTLVHESSPGLPRVAMDAHRLRQVLTNLVMNAVKYGPPGSTVTVRTRLDRRQPNRVVIDVIDEGPGIPAEQRETVFEKFHQVDPGSKGLGLGLYISRRLMNAMGGQVWLADVERGTCVSILLPAGDDASRS